MPITKLESGQIILHFGTGDILIACAADTKKKKPDYIIIFQDGESYPIDKPIPEMIGKKIDKWIIKMYFDKSESLDSLIHQLQDFKSAREKIDKLSDYAKGWDDRDKQIGEEIKDFADKNLEV